MTTMYEQAVKDNKLTGTMVAAIMDVGRQTHSSVKLGTIVALINRGVLTTATPRTRGRNLLTEKGVTLFRTLTLVDGEEPEASTTEEYVVANTVVFEEGNEVTRDGREDLGIGVVKQVSPSGYGQLLVIQWANSPVSYPSQTDGIRLYIRPEAEVTEPVCDNCGEPESQHAWTCNRYFGEEPEETSTATQTGGWDVMAAGREAAAKREQEAISMGLSAEQATDYVCQTGRWAPQQTEPEQPAVAPFDWFSRPERPVDLATLEDRRPAVLDKPGTAERFNQIYPVGTLVIAYPGVRPEWYRGTVPADFTALSTVTRSVAWNLGHGEPVVCVKGYAGGISLEHIDVIAEGS